MTHPTLLCTLVRSLGTLGFSNYGTQIFLLAWIVPIHARMLMRVATNTSDFDNDTRT
ncbi:hypothetical protein SCHPADRAFT_369008 [Schizopora paradoxa]|uniref:Uncharacterized protein n=1 Tax=Schizopora paradoxa TaxID=27342 RepID=A0A0H2RNY2_9AGAM|nr:hypothetical protein SCHPADRAFT_369008 [Schizopora paradoxa]